MHIIIIKMIEYRQNILLFLAMLSLIRNNHLQLWFGPELLHGQKNPDFWVPRGQNQQSLLHMWKSPRHLESSFYGLLLRSKNGFLILHFVPTQKDLEIHTWCRTHLPRFISSQEWPPYSPDLNPMDYSIWAILEVRACATPHKNLESLMQALLREWDKIPVQELRRITENFSSRLRLCIRAKGAFRILMIVFIPHIVAYLFTVFDCNLIN